MRRTRAKRPPDPAAGRPMLYGEKMASTSIRMTDAQKAKLQRLGGNAWVRRKIDEASVFAEKVASK